MQDNNAQNSNATEQQNQAAAESYYRKGLNALLGIGRVKDYSVAFACFKEARTLGHTKATYQLGQMYLGKYTDFETNLNSQENVASWRHLDRRDRFVYRATH